MCARTGHSSESFCAGVFVKDVFVCVRQVRSAETRKSSFSIDQIFKGVGELTILSYSKVIFTVTDYFSFIELERA